MIKKALFLLFLLAAGGLLLGFYPKSDKHQADGADTVAMTRTFAVELNVVGVLDAARSHMVSSNLRDNQAKIIYLIGDGQQVKKGDILVKLDPGPYENEVDKLQAEINSLEAAVQAAKQAVEFEKNQVEREVDNAKYNKNVAILEYSRIKDGDGPLKLSELQEDRDKAKLELQKHEAFYTDLLQLREEGFDNQSEIASEKEQVDVYRERFKTASDRYANYEKHVLPALLESARAKQENTALLVDQIAQGGQHKVAQAQATLIQISSKLDAQRSSLQQAALELEKTVVKAPLDGIVIHYETYRDGQKRKPRVGDTLFPNQPILYLPDISQMVVKSKAREVDLHKLELGQKAAVKVDAYPDESLSGKLSFIGALATNQDKPESPEKFFQIAFTLGNKNMTLRPGMTCRVSIQSVHYDNVLSIPLQSVFTDGETTYCFVRKALGRYAKIEITTGGQNEDYVQILSGLQAGDKVSLFEPEYM